MQTFIKKIFILILFLLFFTPFVSFAASVSFDVQKNTFAPGENFLVQVYLDTEGVTANAVEGTIVFPPELLELKEIRDGNSAINFWVEHPHSLTDGQITFSGITAGGFTGHKIFLFGMVLQAKDLGSGAVTLNDVQVLENDGVGTKIDTQIIPLSFSISGEPGSASQPNLTITDTDPPEDFVPYVASDPTIFDGKYFLVFSTVDKGVGVDHYEVREGFWDDYVTAQSPYLLKDQTLGRNIFVKVVDKAGNKRVVEIKAQNPISGLESGIILGIITLVICIFFIKKILEKIWPKLPKHTEQ